MATTNTNAKVNENVTKLMPAIFISADGTNAEVKRNPNDLIVMNAQTDLVGRKFAIIL